MTTKPSVLILVAVLLVMAGCSENGGVETTTVASESTTSTAVVDTTAETTTTQPVTTTSTEATTTSTTELQAPVAYGPTVLVAGREDCELFPPAVPPTWTSGADGTKHARDGEFDCTVINNDPRLAGTAHYTINIDRWGVSEQEGAQVQWGTIRIENEGGAWEADYTGIYTGETGDVFAALFTGTGGYEGLSYYQWAVETFGASWPTKGLVFPGEIQTP
ncbi:MAG: hypothetical protein ABFS21_05920 [Actinomycetota bacterium]